MSVVVGQLYGMGEGYPTPQQPNGIGTPVTQPLQGSGSGPRNAQLPNERIGQYNPGCGHSMHTYDVKSDTINGEPAKIVCCPICSQVQAIISPASLYYTDPGFALLLT